MKSSLLSKLESDFEAFKHTALDLKTSEAQVAELCSAKKLLEQQVCSYENKITDLYAEKDAIIVRESDLRVELSKVEQELQQTKVEESRVAQLQSQLDQKYDELATLQERVRESDQMREEAMRSLEAEKKRLVEDYNAISCRHDRLTVS